MHMMSEAKVTVPDLSKCSSDDRSSSALNQSINVEMDQQLPIHEDVSFVSGQHRLETGCPQNIVNVPDENIKRNLKENVCAKLQIVEPQPLNNASNLTVACTSSENVEVNHHNQLVEGSILKKIQNSESSVAPSSSTSVSNIVSNTVNTENTASGFALNSENTENMASGFVLNNENIQQPMQTSCSEDSNSTLNLPNDTSHLLTSTADVSQKNNQERINNSLQLICDYGSDSDIDDVIEIHTKPEDIIIGPSENEKVFLNDYRTAKVLFSEDSDGDSDSTDEKSDSDSSTSSSNSSSSSSNSSSSSSNSSCSIETENASAVRRNVTNNTPKPKKKDPMRTRGEILIEDLPPIEDLHISVPAEECVELGKISSIVDQLVVNIVTRQSTKFFQPRLYDIPLPPVFVVQAFKNTPPLDLDSILFLDHGRETLGQIFDVFGPVTEPLYCVRFNSADHIKEKGIEKDMAVYCAPKTKHTTYVFVPDLLRMKGSDASWEDNNEPPPKCLDYSDDEEERRARRSLQSEERKVTDEGPEQPKKKKTRSTSFERRMNERNLRMTALHANKSATVAVRHANNNNSNSNSNNNSFQGFENSAWWAAPIQPRPRFQHCLNRPPRPPCTPSPPRLIQPAAFTVPPPTFFPPLQPPPFLSYNHVFPPSVPPFDPNRPPPSFGFPPPMPPQMPFHRPPP